MKLKIISSHNTSSGMYDFHLCNGDDGKMYQIDLMVDGGLGDIDPLDIIGKTVSISFMHAWIAIGHDVKLSEE